jgi:hypothetical protein
MSAWVATFRAKAGRVVSAEEQHARAQNAGLKASLGMVDAISLGE